MTARRTNEPHDFNNPEGANNPAEVKGPVCEGLVASSGTDLTDMEYNVLVCV